MGPVKGCDQLTTEQLARQLNKALKPEQSAPADQKEKANQGPWVRPLEQFIETAGCNIKAREEQLAGPDATLKFRKVLFFDPKLVSSQGFSEEKKKLEVEKNQAESLKQVAEYANGVRANIVLDGFHADPEGVLAYFEDNIKNAQDRPTGQSLALGKLLDELKLLRAAVETAGAPTELNTKLKAGVAGEYWVVEQMKELAALHPMLGELGELEARIRAAIEELRQSPTP